MTANASTDPKDNLFGICHAIGAELGVNPLWLRLGFACALLWNPVAVIAAYAASGCAVLATRLLMSLTSGERGGGAAVTPLPCKAPTTNGEGCDLAEAA